LGRTLLIVTLLPYGKLRDLIFMESDPTKDPDKQQGKDSSPKGDTSPVMNRGNQPFDQQERPDNTGGGANKPPAQNDNLAKPEGSDGKKKWGKDDTLKILPIIFSFLTVCGAYWAIQNTLTTMHESQVQFEKTNRPFLELSSLSIDSTATGQYVINRYTLTNKGKFPALTTSYREYWSLQKPNTIADSIIAYDKRNAEPASDTTIGIVPFSPTLYERRGKIKKPLTEEQARAIATKEVVFTLYIDVKYDNLVSGDHYNYIQVVKVETVPTINVTSLRYIDAPVK